VVFADISNTNTSISKSLV